MKIKTVLLTTCAFLYTHVCTAQFPASSDIDNGRYEILEKDTLFHGVSYNLIEFYETGEVKAFVNVGLDTVANGKCIFLRKNGKKLATGQFENNRAVDEWTYYNWLGIKKNSTDWDWDAGFDPVTHVVVRKKKESIYQVIYWEHGRMRF